MDGEIPALQLAGSHSEHSFPRKIDIKPASCQSWGLLSGGLLRPDIPRNRFTKNKVNEVDDWAGYVQDKVQKGFDL